MRRSGVTLPAQLDTVLGGHIEHVNVNNINIKPPPSKPGTVVPIELVQACGRVMRDTARGTYGANAGSDPLTLMTLRVSKTKTLYGICNACRDASPPKRVSWL